MRLPTGLFFALVIIMVFTMLFKLEPMLTSANNIDSQIFIDSFNLSERMRSEANFDFQLQSSFNSFREQLYRDPETVLVSGKEPEYLKDLPPHTLAVAIADNVGNVSRYVELQGNTNPELVKKFVWYDYLTREKQEEVNFEEKYAQELSRAERLLNDFLGVETDRIALMQLRSSRISLFESKTSSIGLYWDNQTLKSGQKAYFFSRFDLSNTNYYMPIKALLKKINKPGTLCAFYDLKRKNFVSGSGFQKFMKDPAFIALGNACRDLSDSNKLTRQSIAVVNSSEYFSILGSRIVSLGMVPVVVVSKKRQADNGISKNASVLAFSIICLAFTLFIQTFCFGRGLRVNVGKALILASLLAIFMPFMMGQSVFRLILGEASENESLKLERELHNLISGMDSGVRLFHGNLLQNFKHLLVKDSTLRDLQAEETADAARLASNFTESKVKMPDLISKLAGKAFEPFVEGLNLPEDNHRKANAITIIGPGGFIRHFDRFKDITYYTGLLPETDSMFMILNIYRHTIEKFFLNKELVPDLKAVLKQGKAGEVEQFKFEEIRRQFSASIGKEKVYEMLVNYEGLNHFRTSMGLVNFSVFPLWVNKLIRYFCGVAWDEYATSRVYLGRTFASFNRGQDATKVKGRSFFAYLDPASYFPKPRAFIQAYANIRADMLYSGDAESARMSMLLKSSYRSKKIIKEKSKDEDQALYQIMPGRFFTLYILGGRQETSHLKKIEEWRAIILLIGMAIFVLFAALSAVNISKSVSSPLEHLLWGISMIEKSDYSVRLKDSRNDEFGSISRAFNLMARRLRERDTLGKFVSPSVRKLARNPELFKIAQRGIETEVTVLFADLEGFSAFAANAASNEVQAKLEFTLTQFYRIAEDLGGEVDKLIGGKLLIIFHHQQIGRKKAALAAVELARSIIEVFRTDSVIKPVFGLNSGRVISGIIGTPAVRMDNTVIGDPVNVAARLCSLADSRRMPVVVSGEIIAELGGLYLASRVDVNTIKGKKQEVEVFSLDVSAQVKT